MKGGLINKLKEKVAEFQKLEQKFKLLENKYVIDMSSLRQNHNKETKDLQKEISVKSKYALVTS
jgi:hypothetical protein